LSFAKTTEVGLSPRNALSDLIKENKKVKKRRHPLPPQPTKKSS
jgi:hypothetical protein